MDSGAAEAASVQNGPSAVMWGRWQAALAQDGAWTLSCDEGGRSAATAAKMVVVVMQGEDGDGLNLLCTAEDRSMWTCEYGSGGAGRGWRTDSPFPTQPPLPKNKTRIKISR